MTDVAIASANRHSTTHTAIPSEHIRKTEDILVDSDVIFEFILFNFFFKFKILEKKGGSNSFLLNLLKKIGVKKKSLWKKEMHAVSIDSVKNVSVIGGV